MKIKKTIDLGFSPVMKNFPCRTYAPGLRARSLREAAVVILSENEPTEEEYQAYMEEHPLTEEEYNAQITSQQIRNATYATIEQYAASLRERATTTSTEPSWNAAADLFTRHIR